MVALIGDAELDEGNIFEALMEGWKHGLRNTWWVIDYNRQSLDAVIREGLYDRFEQMFRNFGWDVVTLKYGSLQQAAFKEKGVHVLDSPVSGGVIGAQRGTLQVMVGGEEAIFNEVKDVLCE